MNKKSEPIEFQSETTLDNPEAFETKYVGDVYNKIASHFSGTRYKVCFFTIKIKLPFNFIYLFCNMYFLTLL